MFFINGQDFINVYASKEKSERKYAYVILCVILNNIYLVAVFGNWSRMELPIITITKPESSMGTHIHHGKKLI